MNKLFFHLFTTSELKSHYRVVEAAVDFFKADRIEHVIRISFIPLGQQSVHKGGTVFTAMADGGGNGVQKQKLLQIEKSELASETLGQSGINVRDKL